MVNKKHENKNQDDLEITSDINEMIEPDLEEIEKKEKDVISSLREKFKTCDAQKRELLEETQRMKADFLNARKRLEDERYRERERMIIKHVEKLLPLCDSFQMAMSDIKTWEKADDNWRKGIEGIHSQLQNLLTSYSVRVLNPVGEHFDPRCHEALANIPVTEKKDIDKVIQVIQAGYELKKDDGSIELIRPARVSIGVSNEN